MNTNAFHLLGLVLLLTAFGKETSAEDGMKRDFKIMPSVDDLTLVCLAQNMSHAKITIRDIMLGGNGFRFVKLNDPSRRKVWLSKPTGRRDPVHVIQPNQSHKWHLSMREVFLYDIRGEYYLITWHPKGHPAQYVCLGYADADGNIAPPVVDPRDPTAKPILAFIFHEKQPHELGFLFLNGAGEDVAIGKPLTANSRIIASAPTIDYNRELVIPDATVEEAVVEPGKVGEWRLPWQTVYELIPPEDLEKIKVAGGDLDLVWKVGDYESDPLPISLAAPEQ